MFYRITFSNRDAVAESDNGRDWVIRTGSGYITYQVPDRGYYATPFGLAANIEDALFLCGYSIKSISAIDGENIFGFKAAEGRWEVVKREGDNRSVIGYVYQTGEPGSAYRYEPAGKKKEVRSNSLMRLLVRLKPRNWK